MTVSVGGAAFPAHGSSAATLMRAADEALYVAKSEGRDRWHVPDADGLSRAWPLGSRAWRLTSTPRAR